MQIFKPIASREYNNDSRLIDESRYKNFNDAYRAMSTKLIQNSITNTSQKPALLLTNRDIAHSRKMSRMNDEASNIKVHERLYRSNIKNVSEKTMSQIDNKISQEKKECKFHPETNQPRFGAKKRSINDFLTDMKLFSDRHANKVYQQMQKKKEDEDESINLYFKSNRSKSPNYEKLNSLYQRGVKKQVMRSKSPENSYNSQSNHPQINKSSHELIRNCNVSEILYNDAVRRNKQLRLNRSMADIKLSTSQSSNKNKNNNNYIVSKVAKELEKSIDSNHIALKNGKLCFTDLVYILVDMNYVSTAISEAENKLLQVMWKILKGEEFEGVTIRNVLSFLIGIHGLDLKDIIAEGDDKSFIKNGNNELSNLLSQNNSYIESKGLDKDGLKSENPEISEISIIANKSEISNIGMFTGNNEKFFFKSHEDQLKTKRIFKAFISRKASSARCAYFIGNDTPQYDPSCSFKPEINTKSELMAYGNLIDKRNNSKSKGSPTQSPVSRPEILLNKGKEYQYNKMKLKEDMEIEEMKE